MGGSNMEWPFIISTFITLFVITLFLSTVIIKKLNFKIRLHSIKKETVVSKQQKAAKKTERKNTAVDKFLRKMELNIEAASLPVTLKEFMLILLGCNILIFSIAAILANIIKALILCVFLTSVIFAILPFFQKRRKQKMLKQLPEALELISNALKTGYSIVQTLDLVAKENFSPLSEEFAKLIQALKFGESFEVAFNDLADRLEIPEMRTVVDTILITRETGGNMTHVIEGLLEIMRENQRLQGEVKALTAQGRISTLVIGSMPIFLFALLMMLSPEYMMLFFSHPLGLIMLVIAGTSQIIGYVVMHKLIQLKVR
jgi:tight adherence protein B